MSELFKYRKTMHLPFSKGLKNDDRRMEDEHCFDGKTVAVTIKMDGENTSMYRDAVHARSLYAMTHPSQHYIKGYHASIRHLIPEGWRICGENMYAEHSIRYENLESFFYVFNIWDENNYALPFNETIDFCKANDLIHVPVLSVANIDNANFKVLEELYNRVVIEGEEGIVVRNVESFHYDDFQNNLAKAVRKNHVTSDIHWSKTWKPNKLADSI